MYSNGRTFTARVGNLAIPQSKITTRTVEIVFRSEQLAALGVLIDIGDLDAFGEYVDSELSRRVNDVFDAPPTDERLARHLFAWCIENLPAPLSESLSEVRVSATPHAWASYAAGPT